MFMADPEIREAMKHLIQCPCSKNKETLRIKIYEVTVEKLKGPNIESYYAISCVGKCKKSSVLSSTLNGAVKKWNGMVGGN